MHGHSSSGGTVVSEKLSVHFVVAGEIVHVHKIAADLDHVLEPSSRALQDVGDVLDHRARLLTDIEPCSAQGIDFGASNGVVSPTRAGSGNEQEVTSTSKVRIFPARRRFPFDD